MEDFQIPEEVEIFLSRNLDSLSIKEILSGYKNDPELEFKLALLEFTGKYKEIEKNKESAMKHLQHAAKNKSSHAKYLWGQVLLNGINHKQECKKALPFIEDAAMDGIPEAAYDFANLLFDGEFTPFNPNRAQRYYKIAADHGNVDAQIQYATISLKYEIPMRNYRQAAMYFKMAMKSGLPEAFYGYGYCLKDGLGVPKNLDEAERVLHKAEDKGHLGAIYLLGELFEEREDYKTAINYYNKAISESFVPAYFKLGLIYNDGRGVEQDEKKGNKLIMKAVTEKHPEALMHYGMSIIKKNKDYAEGLKYISEAAELGLSSAQFEAGKIYMSRLEYNKAAYFLKRAADNEVPKAQYSYAYILKSGNCGKVDDEEIMTYYQRAADNGVPKALYGLGLMYETGNSYCKQDIQKAAQLFCQAAEKGVAEAMLKYGEMCLNGNGVQKDDDIGMEYVKRSADAGYAPAQVMYARDLEAKNDHAGAFKYHRMAAKNNVPESQFYAGEVLMKGKKGVVEKDAETAAAFLVGAASAFYGDMEDEF